MRLVAVNERAALYMVEEKPAKIDACAFIADLLDVRNAKHLVRLLIDHSDTITAYKELRLSPRNDYLAEKMEPWFSKGQMQDAADSLRTMYQPDLSGAQERFDSASASEIVNKLDKMASDTDEKINVDDLYSMLHSIKRHEVMTVNVDKLHDICTRWASLLTFAAIGNGETPHRFLDSMDDKANALVLSYDALSQGMQFGGLLGGNWDVLEHRKNRKKGMDLGNLHFVRSGDMCAVCMYNAPKDPPQLLATICGEIAALSINSWGYQRTEIKFEYGRGYFVTDEKDQIIDALRSIIVNDKVRICPICGKPHIPQRKTKKYCSPSCKQTAFVAKKEGR